MKVSRQLLQKLASVFTGPGWSSPITMSHAIVLGTVWMTAAQLASSQQVRIQEAKLDSLSKSTDCNIKRLGEKMDAMKISLGADYNVLSADINAKLMVFSSDLKDMKNLMKKDAAA